MRRLLRWLLPAVLALPAAVLALTPAGEHERALALVTTRCALCHGLQGQGVSAEFPKLAGQHAEYIVKQLFNFRTGQRSSTVMQKMAEDLSASEITVLARYFASLPPQRQPAADPELAAVGRYLYLRGNRWSGVTACIACHGADAAGSAQMPRLAGQHAAYIEARLRSRTAGGKSTLDLMHSSIQAITEMESKAVAQYLSGEG